MSKKNNSAPAGKMFLLAAIIVAGLFWSHQIYAADTCGETRNFPEKTFMGLKIKPLSHTTSPSGYTQLTVSMTNVSRSVMNIDYETYGCRCPEHLGDPARSCIYYWTGKEKKLCPITPDFLCLKPGESVIKTISVQQLNNDFCGSVQLDFVIKRINGIPLSSDQKLMMASFADLCQDCKAQPPLPVCPAGTVNVALNKKTDELVVHPGEITYRRSPFEAVDGNPTSWWATGNYSPASLEINLKEPYPLRQYIIYCGGQHNGNMGTVHFYDEDNNEVATKEYFCTGKQAAANVGGPAIITSSTGLLNPEILIKSIKIDAKTANYPGDWINVYEFLACATPKITCNCDNECGISGFFGQTYCDGSCVYKDYKSYKCENPGSPYAKCISTIKPIFWYGCGFGQSCKSGFCHN